MDKIGRNYNIQIQLEPASQGYLNVHLPFTAEFDIVRNLNSQANTCVTRIYNLSKEHRNQIRFNIYQGGPYRSIVIQAGYGTSLSTIHSGQIQEAHSYREGVNFITEITSFDAYSAYTARDLIKTFPASVTNPLSKKKFLQHLIEDLGGTVSVGVIGNYTGSYYRPYSVSKSGVDALREESGNGFFIDNGVAHCLADNEYIFSPNIPTINSASGLLGTPKLELHKLTFDMLFEPSLYVGQIINLQSTTFQDSDGTNLNGTYKVNELKHRAIISPVVCGDAITSVGMLNNIGKLTPVNA